MREGEIKRFLEELAVKLNCFGMDFYYERPKNARALLELDLNLLEIKKIIEDIKIEDYSQGPFEDELYVNSKICVFGKEVKGEEVYIKISLGAQEVFCISFHKSEYPMKYPLKKKRP